MIQCFKLLLQHLWFYRAADLAQRLTSNIYVFLALEAGLMPVSLGKKQILRRLMEMEVS